MKWKRGAGDVQWEGGTRVKSAKEGAEVFPVETVVNVTVKYLMGGGGTLK